LLSAAKVLNGEHFAYVRELVDGDNALLEFVSEIDGITINGIDLIRQVRMISTLPIIIVSSYGESSTVTEGLNAGADDFHHQSGAQGNCRRPHRATRHSSCLRRRNQPVAAS
ncbi:MAG: response regulator, partial [Acetobacteraceae bacterium]|nr:response regulator [Acetobacteraceae bacterium]